MTAGAVVDDIDAMAVAVHVEQAEPVPVVPGHEGIQADASALIDLKAEEVGDDVCPTIQGASRSAGR